ncbi:tetratricopeptide TPR_2 repeat protein [Caballeronia mineralivorans PML1(12)]|uniref:Tetratricopeptide TPR_2 repeat protein n=1 Tax=Caballeronia mineralivorans PML1(12) TaxID=908627 RepID=A0A0J1CIK3_9BURK|nr:tetratricopeptide repeat protein [Caballeronia mineralivorans]KLU20497.1 tetratricopeptide TPR_2 repeat protein [Caballeronia mineralivorans PML1(12)]
MKKFLAMAFVSLALMSGTAFAVPTAQQVETAMQQGNWQQADAGLTEVLQAHPDDARAHYLYGQVLDREGRYAAALTQIQQARTLDPQVHFTDPSRFARTEARIRRMAERAGAITPGLTSNPVARQTTPAVQRQTAFIPQAPQHHGPGMGLWIGFALLIAAIAFVLRWTLRRARSRDDARADDDRRVQLKRATELLNAVRSLKLDVRLSSVPGHEALEKEVEGAEARLRERVDTLSNSRNLVLPDQLDDLERQVAGLKARAEGRPDPNAATPASTAGPAYAWEASERFGRQPQVPDSPVSQQQPIIVQQGGGFGGGLGGLLTGMLLGEALNSGRDRVIERDVPGGGESWRRGGNGSGPDFGQGENDWSDGGGDIDVGSNDDSGGWSDT